MNIKFNAGGVACSVVHCVVWFMLVVCLKVLIESWSFK